MAPSYTDTGTLWGRMEIPTPPFLGAQPPWKPTFHLLGSFLGSNEKAQIQHMAQCEAHGRHAMPMTVLQDAGASRRQTQPLPTRIHLTSSELRIQGLEMKGAIWP